TISAKSPEFAVDGSFRSCNDRSANFQRQVCNIIHDTDGEFLLLVVVVYSYDLSRCGVLGTKTVTSGKDLYCIKFCSLQSCNNIQVQRLAQCARLFCSVQEDRKSTRLNSSHVSISYAAFCLKKKRI